MHDNRVVFELETEHVVGDEYIGDVSASAGHHVGDVPFFVERGDHRADDGHRSEWMTNAGRNTIDVTRQHVSVTIETMPKTRKGP